MEGGHRWKIDVSAAALLFQRAGRFAGNVRWIYLIIVNKECNDAYNISHVVNIYMASDGNTIKAVAGTSTRGGILGKYKTIESARKAFDILMKRIEVSSREIVYMPTDEEVEREIKAGNKMHSINGKKQKGHGGS